MASIFSVAIAAVAVTASPLSPLSPVDQKLVPSGAGCTVSQGARTLLATDYMSAVIRIHGRIRKLRSLSTDGTPEPFGLENASSFYGGNTTIIISALGKTRETQEEESVTPVELRLFDGDVIYPIRATLRCFA